MAPTPRPRPPLGFAHRGARAECPDNTLAGFRRALQLGAGALESDAWLTVDGHVVLDHDGLVGPRWRRRRIADVRRADLPSQIPALEELYRDCGSGYDLSLDVKDRAAAAEAVAVAEAAGAAGRLWLCSSGPVLARWRRLSDAVHLVDSTGWGQIREGLSARARRLRAEGVDALNLPWRDWTAARVGAVHEEGVLAFAWGAQRTALIAALCRMGVDGVYSDHVRRMQEGIRRGAARQNQCSRESGQMRTKARPTMRDRDTGPK